MEVVPHMRDKILQLERTMREMPEGSHCNPEVSHFYEEGLYARAVLIPAGATLVGKIHKHGHYNHIDFGHGLVATEQGVVEFHGPQDFVSLPGTKRVVHAITDILWVTYHENPTNSRDLAFIESQIIAPSYAALEHSEAP